MVEPPPDPRSKVAAVDRTGGRTASREQLRLLLGSASPEFLAGAFDNPELTESEMVLLLRNRQVPADLLRKIAGDSRWTRHYGVKRGIALHPHTPVFNVRNLIPHLFWKELCEVACAPQANPVARRQAEELLRVRLQEMNMGQLIALARRASRGVIGGLLHSRETPVLRSLLDNPRMVEMDAVRIASGRQLSPELLAHAAAHHRWGPRRSVRLALVANPRTPISVSQRLVRQLPPADLQRLSKDVNVPKIVRVAADRLLGSRPSAAKRLGASRATHG